MPVPKRKRSRTRRDKRFANKGLKVKSITDCQNCSAPLPTHQACPECGFYKGVKIFETKADRALKRGKERQARAKKKGAIQQQLQKQQEIKEAVPEEETKK